MFCSIELMMFFDLLATRVFFVGVSGYPQIFTSFFLSFYEIFYLLGTTGYFSLFLENFLYFDVKFPIFYFSDSVPYVQRYPLVQPYHIANPLYDRPNFFLWLFDAFVKKISGDFSKSAFFSNDLRFVFQRELLQDIRKYNYIRKYQNDLQLTGQLFLRGWNGFNYRLDLKIIAEPILPTEQVVRFDWRFKNSHFDGITSRLFKSDLFGSSQARTAVTHKNLNFLRNRYKQLPSRYGFLDYSMGSQDSNFWVDPKKEIEHLEDKKEALYSRAKILSGFSEFDRQHHRFHLNSKIPRVTARSVNKFNSVFSPVNYKFYKMK